MSSEVRVRFAPAPTGLLHIGNARTALFNYLFAKKERGTFVLRIEDTDVERSTEASIDAILKDLKWLGIVWDEGPDVGGPFGPYRQTQRLSLYRKGLDELIEKGKAYKCFCSPERLESLRKEQLSKGMMPKYDGKCRSLGEKEISASEAEGQRPVFRFRVDRGVIAFQDLIHGRMSFDSAGISDFIIIRSDGMAAYNFACVIDDHAMNITHVIRGDDHLSNTPRQILIYRAMGWSPPTFAHHPLILGPDRTPLSKRHGATAVSQYREEGFLSESLLNYLVLLGWSPPEGNEILSLDKMIQSFSLSGLSRNAPTHSIKKLEWLNSHYIRHTDKDRLFQFLLPYLEKDGISVRQNDPSYLKEVCYLLRDNLTTLSQVRDYSGIFFDEKFYFEEEAKNRFSEQASREILQKVLTVLEDLPESASGANSSLLKHLEEKTGQKGKSFYATLRAGITGKMKGPELAKILPLLGKERIIKRLKMALEIA